MTASFTAYIDESGDEDFVFRPQESGSSRWLVLSAVVFRKSKDLEAVKTLRAVRELLGKPPKYALHFRDLRHEAINHDQLAGLQMADAVASSLFFALNLSQYGEVESRYFELLKPTVYRHDKTGALGYGLKFWPKSADLLQTECPHVAVFTL
jgi:Protein of unknown function (DUF3800)